MKKIRWDDIYGHEKQKKWLEGLLNNGTPHCLLFTGLEGIGKKLIAERLAMGFNCEEMDVPCEKCSSCRNFSKQAGFANTYYGNNELKIEEIRSLRTYIEKSDLAGKVRVIIIDNLQRLNKIAANALLKILEEPSKNVVFILLTTDHRKILPTIISRCLTIHFDKLNEADIMKMVENWGGIDISENKSWFFTGQPALVKKLAEGKDEDMATKMISFWKMMTADVWVKNEIVKKIALLEKDKISGVMFFWEVCLRSFLLWRYGLDKYCWWHEKKLLEWYNNCNFDNQQIETLLDKLGQLKADLNRNYSKKIQIFNFLLDF